MPSALPKEMERIVMMTGLIERFLGRLEGVEARIQVLEGELGAGDGPRPGVSQPHLPFTLEVQPRPKMEP